MEIIYYDLNSKLVTLLALVVQRINNTIHWKNRNPVDSMLHFFDSYLLDGDLSVG